MCLRGSDPFSNYERSEAYPSAERRSKRRETLRFAQVFKGSDLFCALAFTPALAAIVWLRAPVQESIPFPPRSRKPGGNFCAESIRACRECCPAGPAWDAWSTPPPHCRRADPSGWRRVDYPQQYSPIYRSDPAAPPAFR